MTKRRILIALAALIVLVGAFFAWMIGPRNIIGLLFYDQRREGSLVVGDRAPDVALAQLDGTGDVKLSAYIGEKPLVIVFGSFT